MEQRSDSIRLELRKNIGVPADLQNGHVQPRMDSKGLTLLTPDFLLLSNVPRLRTEQRAKTNWPGRPAVRTLFRRARPQQNPGEREALPKIAGFCGSINRVYISARLGDTLLSATSGRCGLSSVGYLNLILEHCRVATRSNADTRGKEAMALALMPRPTSRQRR